MYLIRAVTVHSNRPKEVWFGPSAYTARILWSGGEIFLLRALGDHLWGHSGALRAPRRAARADRRRRQLPKPLPVSGAVCWRSGSLGQHWGDVSMPTVHVCAVPAARASVCAPSPTVSKASCSSCVTVSSPISLISSPFDFVFFVFCFN